MQRHPDQEKIGIEVVGLVAKAFSMSNSEARRQIVQGAIRFNRDMNSEHKISDPFARLCHDGDSFIVVEWLGTEKQVVQRVESMIDV